MQCKENPAPGAAVLSGAAMSLSPTQSFGGGDYKTVGGVSYRVSCVRVICMQEGSWIVDTASPDQKTCGKTGGRMEIRFCCPLELAGCGVFPVYGSLSWVASIFFSSYV